MLMIIAETAVEISVDIELAGDVRAWRPKSVHSYFGEGREKLFAWLCLSEIKLAHTDDEVRQEMA
jgi:hypothetical protein